MYVIKNFVTSFGSDGEMNDIMCYDYAVLFCCFRIMQTGFVTVVFTKLLEIVVNSNKSHGMITQSVFLRKCHCTYNLLFRCSIRIEPIFRYVAFLHIRPVYGKHYGYIKYTICGMITF